MIRVLVVEDSAAQAAIIADRTRRYPHDDVDVRIVRNLHDAIETLTYGGVDLLLLDLTLPDSFGIKTVEAVREKSAVLPVIVVTGNVDKRIAELCLGANVQGYLEKSEVADEDLWQLIRSTMEKR